MLRFGATSIASSSRQDQARGPPASASVNSFRRLTLAEIQSARPLRLKVITAQPGDTVESLSHRMASVDHQLERFRVLNGFDTHAAIKPRDRVKIVVD